MWDKKECKKKPHTEFFSGCWNKIKRKSAKKVIRATTGGGGGGGLGSENCFTGTCRRTWFGHGHVMLTLVSGTMRLSWLISCGACQHLQVSHEWKPYFFVRSMFLCFSLLRCSWGKSFVVVHDRQLRFLTVGDTDRQGRRPDRFIFSARSWDMAVMHRANAEIYENGDERGIVYP